MSRFRAIVTLVLLGLVLIFLVQNATAVEIHFLAWSFAVPRALLVMVLLGIGFLVGLTMSSISALKQGKGR